MLFYQKKSVRRVKSSHQQMRRSYRKELMRRKMLYRIKHYGLRKKVEVKYQMLFNSLDVLTSFMQSPLQNFINSLSIAANTVGRRISNRVGSAYSSVRSDVTSTLGKVRAFLKTIIDSLVTQLSYKYFHIISQFRLFIDLILDKVASTISSLTSSISQTFGIITGTVISIAILMIVKAFSHSNITTFFLAGLMSAYMAYSGNYISSAITAVFPILMNHQYGTQVHNNINVSVGATSAKYQIDEEASEVTENSFLSSLAINQDIKSWLFKTISIISLISLGTCGLKFTSSNIDDFLRRHTLLHKAFQSWEWIFKYASDWISQTYILVSKYFYGQDVIDPNRVQDVEDLYNEVVQLCTLEAQQQVGRNTDIAVRIEQLYRKYLYLRRLYADNRKAVELLAAVLPPLVNLYKRVIEKNPLNAQFRKEPVCVSIKGKPGVGKSYILQVMQRDLASILGKEDNYRDISMYMRCSEQEYWDGYAGQQICCFDDIGQRVDSVANPNIEFFELIRSVNIFPYMLHSAALHEKANNTFISDFVVLTTNLAQFNIHSIISKEALQRRIHIDVDMSVIPEVQKDRSSQLDLHKLKEYRQRNNLPDTDLSHVEFLQREQHGDTARTRRLTYDQFIKVIEEQHLKHVEDFEKRQEYGDAITPWSQRRDNVLLPQYQIEYQIDNNQNFSNMREYGRVMSLDVLHRFLDEEEPNAQSEEFAEYFVPLSSFLELTRAQRTTIRTANMAVGLPTTNDEWTEFYPMYASTLDTLSSYNAGEIEQWQIASLHEILEFRHEAIRRMLDLSDTSSTTSEESTLSAVQFFERHAPQGIEMEIDPDQVTTEQMDHAYAEQIDENAQRSHYWHRMFIQHIQHVHGREPTDEEEMEFFQRYTLADRAGTLQQTLSDLIRARSLMDKIKESLKTIAWEICMWLIELAPIFYIIITSLLIKSVMTNAYNNALNTIARIQTEQAEAAKSKEEVVEANAEEEEQEVELEAAAASGQRERRPRKQRYEDKASGQRDRRRPPTKFELDEATAERFQKLGVKKVRLQGLTSEIGYKVAQSVRRNVYTLYMTTDPLKENYHEQRLGQVTMIKGHIGIINAHFVATMSLILEEWIEEYKLQPEEVFVDFRALGAKAGTLQSLEKFISSLKMIQRPEKDSDMQVFVAPRSLPLAADISNHLIDKPTLNKISRGLPVLLATQRDGKEVYRTGSILDMSTVVINQLGMQKEFVQMIRYNCDTMQGDCGAPLIAQSDLLNKKILGFHFAGEQGFGVAQPVTKDDIETCYPLTTQGTSEITLDYQSDEMPKFTDGNFKYIGHVPEMAASSTKTAIQPSLLHGLFEVKTAPAKLAHPYVKDGPMLKGIQKYGGPTIPLDDNLLNQSINSYTDVLFMKLPKPLEIEKRVLTTTEAIRGIEGNEFSCGIKRSKSAGYPWMFYTDGKPGKTKWLGKGDDYDLSSDNFKELNKRVDAIEEMCRKNIVPEAIFVDTLKDERRILGKVQAGKTRVFAAAPMDYTVVQRKYFLGFLSFMTRTKIWNECGVGTNAHSTDWKGIVDHLTLGRFDKTMIAGDFTNFDGTLNYYILESICDIINDYYGDHPSNKRVRRALWRAISNCKHLFGSIVYQLNHSQPSGNAATAVINSMYNSIAVRYCYGTIFGEVHSFNRYIKMIAYGDDNIISVNPIIHERFNPVTLAEAFTKIGMVYTSEDKGEQSSEFRSIREVTFLKRGFNVDGDYVFAPLSLDSIRESVMWIHKSPSPEQACVDNVKMMLIELYHHDFDTFEDISYQIQSELSKHGLSITIHPYQRVRNMIRLNQSNVVFDTYLAYQNEQNFKIIPFDDIKNYNNLKTKLSQLTLQTKYQGNMTKYDHHPSQSSSNSAGAQQQSSTIDNVKVGTYDQQGQVDGSENAFTSGQTTTETQDTSTFVSYGPKETRDYVAPHDDNQVMDALRPSSEISHSVESYLSRPVLIGNYELAQNNIADIVFTCDIMPQLAAIPEFMNKLQGFYGFRAKANFKVVANAQPFEFGLLNIFYIPFRRIRQDLNETLKEIASLGFTTSCPNAIMNLNTQSEVVLSADYTGPNAFINLTNEYSQFGRFHVQVLTSPRNLNSTSVSIPLKFYLYFTDVELYGATSKSVAKFQMEDILKTGTQLLSSVLGSGSNHPQMDSQQQGTESSIASLGKTILPLILAGLSKPPQKQPTERVALQPFANPQLMDTTANVHKLSALSSQAVNIAPMGVQAQDEMDITHLVSKPTYYDNITWVTGDTDKKELWHTRVEPNVMLSQALGTNVSQRYAPNRVHGVANYFDFWRGSMEYTFYIAGTNFHSGRLCFVYSPSNDDAKTAYDSKHLNYYAVWDLRKGNTFKLVLPYIATTMWRPVARFAQLNGANLFGQRSTQSHFDDTPNTLFVYVENALKVPDASSQELDIAVFVSAGNDFQVAAPCAMRNIINAFDFIPDNIPHAETPNAVEKEVEEKVEAKFQGEDVSVDIPILNLVAGKNIMPNPAPISTEITMGENITNMRSLIKRYRVAGSGVLQSGMYCIAPWAYYGGHIDKGDNHLLNFSYLDQLRSCYAFYRGGMRYLFHFVSANNSKIFATIKYRTEANFNGYNNDSEEIHTFTMNATNDLGRNMIAGTVGWKNKDIDNPIFQAAFPSSLSVPFIPELSGGIEVEAPYYSRVHKTLNYGYSNLADINNVTADEANHLQPSGFIYLEFKSFDQCWVHTYKAAADDFNLGFFLGFPAHITNITVYEPVEKDHWIPSPTGIPKELSDRCNADHRENLENENNIGIIHREKREGRDGTALDVHETLSD